MSNASIDEYGGMLFHITSLLRANWNPGDEFDQEFGMLITGEDSILDGIMPDEVAILPPSVISLHYMKI